MKRTNREDIQANADKIEKLADKVNSLPWYVAITGGVIIGALTAINTSAKAATFR